MIMLLPDYIRKYADYELVFGDKTDKHKLIQLIADLKLEASLITLSSMNWLVYDLGIDIDLIQKKLVDSIFPERKSRFIYLLKNGYIFFFNQQLLTLMKIISAYCKEDPPSILTSQQFLETLGHSSLATTSLISQVYEKKGAKKKQEKSKLLLTFQDLVLNSFYLYFPKENLSLVRAINLFSILLNEEINRGDNIPKEIKKIFLKNFGISIEDYLIFGFVLTVYYYRFKDSKLVNNFEFILFKPKVHLSNTKIEDKVIEKILSLVSCSIDDLGSWSKCQKSRELTHNFILLKQKPLIQLSNNQYIPTSFNYLIEKLSMGIYWMILDSFRKEDISKSYQFSSFTGQIFQRYIEKIVEENWKKSNGDYLIEFDQIYTINNQEYRTPDLLLFKDECLIIFEISKTKLQELGTIVEGNPKSYERDIKKIIIDNATSLDKQIILLSSNKVKIGNIDFSQVRKIFPVIVLLDMLPKIWILNSWVNEIIDSNHLFKNKDQVEDLVIIESQDLELLEAYTNLSLFNIIQQWRNVTSPDFISLGDYLYEKNLIEENFKNNSFINKTWEDYTNKATKLMFGIDSVSFKKIS